MMVCIPGKTGVWFALLAMLALAACQRGSENSAPACPVIGIVKDAAELTLFAPGLGRGLTMEAEISEFGGFCETDINEDDGTGIVEIDLRLLFSATRGPASVTHEEKISYFVAITDLEENILAREVFTFDFEFESNRNRIGYVEDLIQKIPIQAGKAGTDFKVLIGMQLDEEQLTYNRNKRVR
ncbi:MAG: hypothetical protein OSB67_04580 [Alphaproteobacteria bacterium]|nr:hypothetical protein [Alphaproteobacteria bacterium]